MVTSVRKVSYEFEVLLALIRFDLVGSVANHDDHMITDGEIILDFRMIVQQFEVIITQECNCNELDLIRVIECIHPDTVTEDKGAISNLLDRFIAIACTHSVF